MDEKTFIYGRLKSLTEQTATLFEMVEKQADLIGKLSELIDKMQTPEYAKKQATLARVSEGNEKIEAIRRMAKGGR